MRVSFFFHCLVFHLTIWGQSVPLKTEDFGYYYILNSNIIDSRTHQILRTVPQFNPAYVPYHKYHSDLKLLTVLNSNKVLSNSDLSGRLVSTVNLSGRSIIAFSQNWKEALYLKEGDIWKLKINYKLGTTSEDKRLTSLGSITSVGVNNWVGEKLLFQTNYINYELNTNDGSIKEITFFKPTIHLLGYVNASGSFQFPLSSFHISFPVNLVSPDYSKYIILNREKEDYVYTVETASSSKLNLDLVKPSAGDIPYEYTCLWFNDNNCILYIYDWQNKTNNHKLFNLNISSGDVRAFPVTPQDLNKKDLINDSQNSGISRIFSSDQSYFILPKSATSSLVLSGFYVFERNNPINVQTLNHSDLGSFTDSQKYGSIVTYKWINRSSFIFKKQGDLLTQGTYIYNVETKETKKISSFLIESVLILPTAQKVLFIANNHLFSMNTQGGTLEQISKTPLSSKKLVAFNWAYHLTSN